MGLILLLILLVLVFGAVGFAFKLLWILAVVALAFLIYELLFNRTRL